MDKEIKLLPCSFCGSNELSNDGHEIICEICKAQGPALFPIPNANEVIRLWNTRPSDKSELAIPLPSVEEIKAELLDNYIHDKSAPCSCKDYNPSDPFCPCIMDRIDIEAQFFHDYLVKITKGT